MYIHNSIDSLVKYLEGKSNDISFISPSFMGYRDKSKNLLVEKDIVIEKISNLRSKITSVSYEMEDSHALVYYLLGDIKYISKVRFDNDGLVNSIVEEIYNPNNSVCVLRIEYDGKNYYGMQKQKKENESTIQDELEKALKEMLNKDVIVYPASRTDRGVHAKGQVVHFDSNNISPDSYKYALNNLLPKDIRIKDAYLRSQLFNARYDVVEKTYNYIVDMSDYSVFNKDYVYYHKVNNIAKIRKELKSLIGTHDFKAFCKGEKEDTIRTIYDASVHLDGTKLIFTFTGDGFLHNMIRFIVGSLLKIDESGVGSLKHIIDSKDKNLTNILAPASGLYLVNIKY